MIVTGKKTRGSAMIIALIITTLVSVITIATSQLVLSESQISLRYLDGLVAGYGSDSGVEWGLSALKNNAEIGNASDQNSKAIKEAELNLGDKSSSTKKPQYKTFIWASGKNNSEISIIQGDAQNISVKGAGNSSWKLSKIDKIAGADSCPDPQKLFVYLIVKDQSNKQTILNRISNVTGAWNQKRVDFDYFISGYENNLEIKPLVLTQFLPSAANIENAILKLPPNGCVYNTTWNVDMPGSQITSGATNIKGVGFFEDVEKENTIIK